MPIQMINEIKDIIGGGDMLSPSLRLTKFAKIGGNHEKKDAVDFFCEAKHENIKSCFSVYNAETLKMKLGGRLIINQAGGVLENANLCIHRHFGYPYIPGSALKGIARHSAWEEWMELKEERECSKEQELKEFALKIALTFGYPTNDKMPRNTKDINREAKSDYLDEFLVSEYPELFGDNGAYSSFSGAVSFFAAMPSSSYKLVTDVLTCHHNEYYSGKQEKAYDNENPVPVFFPAVEEGAVFKFTVIPLNKCKLIKNKFDFDPVKFAMDSLKEGLEIHGIGAKTSAGYGWFEEDPAEMARKEREKEELAEIERRQHEEKVKQEEIALKERERRDEIKRQEDEAKAKKEALVESGFSNISNEVDLGKILSLGKRLSGAVSGLSDRDKNDLQVLLKQSYAATGKKDKKWKHPKKSKDTWKQIKALLGDEMTEKLRVELS